MGREGTFFQEKQQIILVNTTAVRHSFGIMFPPSKVPELKSLKTSANDVASATTHPYLHCLRGLHQFVLILKNNTWLAVLQAGLDLVRAL